MGMRFLYMALNCARHRERHCFLWFFFEFVINQPILAFSPCFSAHSTNCMSLYLKQQYGQLIGQNNGRVPLLVSGHERRKVLWLKIVPFEISASKPIKSWYQQRTHCIWSLVFFNMSPIAFDILSLLAHQTCWLKKSADFLHLLRCFLKKMLLKWFVFLQSYKSQHILLLFHCI